MTVVAEAFDFVIGVDTHAENHAYAIVDARTGALIGSGQFPVHPKGLARAIDWIGRRAKGKRLVAVECAGSHGNTLVAELVKAGEQVCEVKPPKREDRARRGKSDEIDALAAAKAVLGVDADRLIQPRSDGLRDALAVLSTSRRQLDAQRTADRNALNALVRRYELGVDARKALTDPQVVKIAAWQRDPGDDERAWILRDEARRLAQSVIDKTLALKENKKSLNSLVNQMMAGIQEIKGVGPVTAAVFLAAWSHRGRVRSEAAFAMMAGTAPLPASSGKTTRYRLNRSGDRQLNNALDVVVKARMRTDQATKDYVTKRTAQGLSHREIRRILRRYVARSLFRTMNNLALQPA